MDTRILRVVVPEWLYGARATFLTRGGFPPTKTLSGPLSQAKKPTFAGPLSIRFVFGSIESTVEGCLGSGR